MTIAVIFLLLASEGVQQATPSNPTVEHAVTKKDANKKTQEREQTNPKESPKIICVGCSVTEPKTEREKADATQAENDPWYRWSLVATVVGVIGAWIGLAFIYMQIRLAKASADALISIERPWLFATTAVEMPERFDGNKPQDKTHTAVWHFQNFGKTPAFIVEIGSTLEIVNNPETDLSPEPIYGKPYRLLEETSVLAPGQDSQAIGTKMSRPSDDQEWKDCILGKKALVLYCRIKYSSAFKGAEPHETRFCYQYVSSMYHESNSGFIRLCGPKAYNRYT